jgi:hypothetical protein
MQLDAAATAVKHLSSSSMKNSIWAVAAANIVVFATAGGVYTRRSTTAMMPVAI